MLRVYPSVYVNSVSPTQLTLNVVSTPDQQDLSTSQSATIAVKLPDGTFKSWTATVVNPTSRQVTVVYSYLTGDLPIVGEYFIRVDLTLTGGGVVKTSALPLLVIDDFEPLG